VLRLELFRSVPRFALEEPAPFFRWVGDFGFEEELTGAGGESAACPMAGNAGHTATVRNSAKKENL